MDVNKQMCVPFPLLAHQVILVFDFTPIAAVTGADLIYSLRLIVALVYMKRSPQKHLAFIAGDPVPVNLWSHFGSRGNF